MPNPTIPLPFDQLQTKPPLKSQILLSEDMQQVLSLLSGYDGIQRKLIRVSSGGVLYVTSPMLKDIINVTGVGANDDWQGSDIPCSEVIVKAGVANTGTIWVRKNAVAAADSGYPLDVKEWWNFTLENLINLHIHVVVDGDKFIVAYCV